MEVLGKIRRLYYRDGLSYSEIARKTGGHPRHHQALLRFTD